MEVIQHAETDDITNTSVLNTKSYSRLVLRHPIKLQNRFLCVEIGRYNQGWQNPGIYEYFPSRRELLVNPGIYLGNTGYSGKFNFHDNQKVKTWIDTMLYRSIFQYIMVNKIKLLQLKKCSIGF